MNLLGYSPYILTVIFGVYIISHSIRVRAVRKRGGSLTALNKQFALLVLFYIVVGGGLIYLRWLENNAQIEEMKKSINSQSQN